MLQEPHYFRDNVEWAKITRLISLSPAKTYNRSRSLHCTYTRPAQFTRLLTAFAARKRRGWRVMRAFGPLSWRSTGHS